MSILAPFWMFTWVPLKLNQSWRLMRWEPRKTGTTAGICLCDILWSFCGLFVVASTKHFVVMRFPQVLCEKRMTRMNQLPLGLSQDSSKMGNFKMWSRHPKSSEIHIVFGLSFGHSTIQALTQRSAPSMVAEWYGTTGDGHPNQWKAGWTDDHHNVVPLFWQFLPLQLWSGFN